MTDNPIELAEEAVAVRLIADALYVRAKELSARAAASMGRGTLYPTLPDGTELAAFIAPKASFTVAIDTDQLLPWVRQHYPTEVMDAVRPAFVERVRAACKDAQAAMGPGGEVDVPGVAVGEQPGAVRIKATDEARQRAAAAVASQLDGVLAAFARPQIEGETE
jgi:hypothetical protein